MRPPCPREHPPPRRLLPRQDLPVPELLPALAFLPRLVRAPPPRPALRPNK